MPILTFKDVQDSRIPPALGLCPTDPRVAAITNESQMRLGTKGLFYGTIAKYLLAAYGGLITMPPELATIETVAINHTPIPYHDMLYEFLEYGFGTRSRDDVGTSGSPALGGTTGCYGIPEANYRGQFPTFRDLSPNTNAKKLILTCDLAVDVGITVTILGYDNSGNWIRTLQGATYVDGEVITLAQTPGTTSVNNFSNITGIQFAAQRSGQCWLYELDTVSSVTTLSGLYQWFETNPSYGRWLFPSINSPSSTSTCTLPAAWQQRWTQGQIPNPTTPCCATLVEVIGKKAFIPVVLPTDYLFIQNIPALKLMCQGVKKQEDGVSSADVGEAMAFQTMAIKELDDQLDTMLGSGRRMGMNIVGSSFPDGFPVETFV